MSLSSFFITTIENVLYGVILKEIFMGKDKKTINVLIVFLFPKKIMSELF